MADGYTTPPRLQRENAFYEKEEQDACKECERDPDPDGECWHYGDKFGVIPRDVGEQNVRNPI